MIYSVSSFCIYTALFDNVQFLIKILMNFFFGYKILQSSFDKHQSLKFDIRCFSYPGNEVQSPDFGRFLTILEISFNVYTFEWSKIFIYDIKLWANNQYHEKDIFVKSALWSNPYKVLFRLYSSERFETWSVSRY